MLTTALIAFREFFEAFLIVGVFLGVSQTMNLNRRKEIALAAFIGIFLSLALSITTYAFGSKATNILNAESAEFLEGYLMVFAGLFMAYVIFSLHDLMTKQQRETLNKVKKEFSERAFDISLFFMIMFLVLREGFEIALFTASVSLFSTFIQNFYGLFVGLFSASVLGIATYFAYAKLPIKKVFQITEYLIILLGASLTQRGISKLLDAHGGIDLSNIIPLPLAFLPDSDSVVGHLIKNFVGIDSSFSVAKLSVMILYVAVIYLLFIRHRNKPSLKKVSA
ncbi:hypothetical protein EPO56_02930 [Patescibacteria group bacterium]|nr:MAG: hypothetical protein EPO56_02930 [Patescibacteria group bacterium]